MVAKRARRILHSRDIPFTPYISGGREMEKLSWIPLNFDKETGTGSYLIRFAPGGESRHHTHSGGEEFLMLEGELIDDDGVVFKPGDFIHFAPGTSHSSKSPDGCLAFVHLGGRNTVAEGEGENDP